LAIELAIDYFPYQLRNNVVHRGSFKPHNFPTLLNLHHMKRKLAFRTMAGLLIGLVIFFACKKNIPDHPLFNTKAYQEKINTWLDDQKRMDAPIKSENVESLKNSLDFENVRSETLNAEKQLLVIPVKDVFKGEHNIRANEEPILLITLDATGRILQGKLVLYQPEANQKTKIPLNTFSDIYNNRDLQISGMFKFLSVSGGWLYQIGYKSGKGNSYGVVRKKKDVAVPAVNNRTDAIECTDWFLDTTYFYPDGTTETTTVYLGRTCRIDCGSDYQSFCPPDDGSGSGGGNSGPNHPPPPPPPPDCCITDPNIQVTLSTVSDDLGEECGTESVDPSTGLLTKQCIHKWRFARQRLLFWAWDNISHENYVVQKESGVWRFKNAASITHAGIFKDGSEPPCFTTVVTVNSYLPWLEGDRTEGHVSLNFSIKGSISCAYPGPNPAPQNLSSSTSWRA
jgi:hypothetical protein